ncbi:hypothetical protein M409DRAFT_38304 [Zasmidium cellare ATCC 36951]|uniref:ABC transporter n=1 Tax=Zasmidium cellare ATCC 36951 TaxID=1080233 RepID=A0A6A6BUI6_ZASCE|nr:uncharacterized protein M409DRAFT_38304 [Zasmidium cellare ATCC 36951]KAF2158355.1 hypothetical protein M409DRAFT_38304 [Zasmidium cellare ATCC 36951]
MRGECSRAEEDVFGPVVQGCLDNFDFTLLFEETVLFVLPASCLLLLAVVWRIPVLIRAGVVVRASWLAWCKMAVYPFLFISQILFLAFTVSDDSANTRATIAVNVVMLIAVLVMGLLSHLENRRSLRPSSLLTLYLLATTPMNAARCRTLWNMPSSNAVIATFIVFTALIAVALGLELAPKDTLVLGEIEQPSSEEMRGIVERSLLTWIVPTFVYGYRNLFDTETLQSIDPKLARKRMKETVITGMEVPTSSTDASLFRGLWELHWYDLLRPVIPRLCYTALTLAQPYLVQTSTEWVENQNSFDHSQKGGALIGAYALVYIGLAVTYALYRQEAVRAATTMRASLTDFIFRRLPQFDSGGGLAGSATTMVSADIERIQFGVREIHEIWAYLVSAVIALYQIEHSIGVAMLPALGIAIGMILKPPRSERLKVWFQATQDRVSQVVQILADFKSVKMMGYTARLIENLCAARLHEVKRSQRFRGFLIVVATLAQSVTALVPAFGFGTYVLLHRSGDGPVLSAGAAFGTLTFFSILSSSIGGMLQAVFEVVTAVGCISRIESLCKKHYRSDPRRVTNSPHSSVALNHASAKYNETGDDIIHDVSFNVKPGTIMRLVGPTASGKSTLLKMLLGEVRFCTGEVVVGHRVIGYCDQDPWLDNVSIRENIIGPAIFVPGRYLEVIRICALETDLGNIPQGDASICFGHGANLSGGQKARIALARALYACSPIMVLDDCLGGLDANTEHFILENLVGVHGFLREHSITTFLVSSSRKPLPPGIARLSLGADGFSIEETADSPPSESPSLEDSIEMDNKRLSDDDASTRPPLALEASGEPGEKYKRGREGALYSMFIKVGGPWSLLVFTFLTIIFVVGVTYPQIYLDSWVSKSAAQQHKTIGAFLGVFFGLSASSMLAFAIACTQFTLAIAPRISIVFHAKLAKALLCAPLSFFSKTDGGSVTNRFAQDLAIIDQEVPLALIGTVLTILQLLGQCVTLIIGSHYAGFAIPGMLIMVYWVQSMYLPTSYQLRLLDLEAKAPIVSLFVRSIEGLATIRAFGWMEPIQRQSRVYIAASQTPFYLLATAQNMLSLVLDFLTALLAIVVISIAVGTKGGGIGLSLFSVVQLGTSTKLLIAQWTELETSLGAMKRIDDFSKSTPQESSPSRSSAPPADWPSKGEIEFRDVSLGYSSDGPVVISNLSLKIEPGWKIGVCGRTGSGKSTFISSILGLVQVQQGSILVDDIDISRLEPDLLRASITVAPQSAVMFRANVRSNLSQNARKTPSDAEMIELLQKCGIYDKFSERDGLDTLITEDLLSYGEQQVFSIVRAVLHKSRLVLLDEPTSRVDSSVQETIDGAVMNGFEGSTLIYIAHRLEILSKFDRVIVMDQGRIVEFGEPQTLLQSPDSLFASTYSRATSQVSSRDTL